MFAIRRRTPGVSALAVLSLAVAFGAACANSAQAAPLSVPTPATRTVSYQGYQFHVPVSWSVVNLARQPHACVRFDRHAVYLGTPGADQDCPAQAVGRTEALLVEPVSSPAALQGTVDQPMSHQYLATAARVQVTGAYGTDSALVQSIIAKAGIPQGAPKQRPATGRQRAVISPAVAASTANYTGEGFDTCSAPSSSSMSSWKADSPYDAVGIYIGGADADCPMGNLNASWVSQQASDGWHFIPIYAGLEAGQFSSASQGTAAADDAVAQAQSLGFPAGTPLYYDIESYSSSYSSAVLDYLSAWTKEIHAKGYRSGVYSSASSAITDLVNSFGTSIAEPDVVFDANWNGTAGTADSYIPSGDWADHQRIHQYAGNVTQSYGGVSIEIDQDYLDISLKSPTDGIGVWRPSDNTFYLSDSNTSGPTDVTQVFGSNADGDVPLAGDWDDSGKTGYGVFDPTNHTFYLHDGDDSSAGKTDITVSFGTTGDVPVVGDWYGNGETTIGVWRPSTHTFWFPDSNTDATANHSQVYGAAGDLPVTGDWNNSGVTGYGVFRPSDHTFYLHDGDNGNGGSDDITTSFGTTGDQPVSGDWYGNGQTTIGVWRPSTHTFWFPDSNTDGDVNHSQVYGAAGDEPVTGHWNG